MKLLKIQAGRSFGEAHHECKLVKMLGDDVFAMDSGSGGKSF